MFARLVFSSLKSKELSPVIGHKAIQVAGPTVPPSSSPQSSSQSPHSTEHSPHTLCKGRALFKLNLDCNVSVCAGSSNIIMLSFQALKSWPRLLPRYPTASLVGCLTSPQVSLHRSACPRRLPAHLLHTDWFAHLGKWRHPAQGRPRLGRRTHFRPHRP